MYEKIISVVKKYKIRKDVLFILASMLLYIWMARLQDSDSYSNIHILLFAFGILSVYIIAKKRPTIRNPYVICFAIVLALCTSLANYHLFRPWKDHFTDVIFVFIGGVLLYVSIAAVACNIYLKRAVQIKIRPIYVFFVIFVLIAVVDVLFLFSSVYPGILTPDSINQMKQILSGNYSNHHPFYHTLIIKVFVDLGLILFHEINAAVAVYSVFQILFMAAVFSYMAMTLYQSGIPISWIILISIFYINLPHNIIYSVTMWKDVLFGGAVLLFVVSEYRVLCDIGSRKTNYLLVIVGCFGFGLWRSNGWVALMLTVICSSIYLWKNKRKLLFIVATMLVVQLILKYPVLSMLNVTQPDTVEHYSIPEQQIARVLVEERDVSDDEKELIEKIIDIETVKVAYEPNNSDPIKRVLRKGNIAYLDSNKLDYLKLWINLGIKNPVTYVQAWIDQTKGYWYGGYPAIFWLDTVENDIGVGRIEGDRSIRDNYYEWFRTFRTEAVYDPLRSIGLYVWLSVLIMVVLIVKKKEWVLSLPIPTIALTLMISTPLYAEPRYAYAMFTTVPFLSLVALFSGKEEITVSTKEQVNG